MTGLEQKVLEAAREWLTERSPKDVSEKRLAAAVARLWPDDFQTKETCTCGESTECDECPSAAEVEAGIAKWEQESAPAAS